MQSWGVAPVSTGCIGKSEEHKVGRRSEDVCSGLAWFHPPLITWGVGTHMTFQSLDVLPRQQNRYIFPNCHCLMTKEWRSICICIVSTQLDWNYISQHSLPCTVLGSSGLQEALGRTQKVKMRQQPSSRFIPRSSMQNVKHCCISHLALVLCRLTWVVWGGHQAILPSGSFFNFSWLLSQDFVKIHATEPQLHLRDIPPTKFRGRETRVRVPLHPCGLQLIHSLLLLLHIHMPFPNACPAHSTMQLLIQKKWPPTDCNLVEYTELVNIF